MIGPTDPRFVKTVDALEGVPCDDPCMRRDEAPDDFGLPGTSFNICAFWRIQAYSMVGIINAAMRLPAPWDSRI
jgi:GH15 family glucan-1,4-alpha-glucosidase